MVSVPRGNSCGQSAAVSAVRLATHLGDDVALRAAIDLDLNRPVPGEIDASELPRDDVSVDPRSAQTPAAGHEVVAGASIAQAGPGAAARIAIYAFDGRLIAKTCPADPGCGKPFVLDPLGDQRCLHDFRKRVELASKAGFRRCLPWFAAAW